MATRTEQSNGKPSPIRNALNEMGKRDLEDLILNAQYQREFFQKMFKDQRRDIYKECGYPATAEIKAEDYHDLYEREPIAAKTVDIYPDECWQVSPEVYETEDEDDETEFEAAWKELGQQFMANSKWKDETNNPLWAYLHRADRLCGVGRYGCLLLGVDDGGELSEELPEGSGGGERKLLFMRVLDEAMCKIASVEEDQIDERFGKPTFYNVGLTVPSQVTSPTIKTQRVHYSRIVHIADNLQTDEVLGIPRMQRAYNRLYDLNKLYGGSAEMYWQGAFPGLSFETHPQLGGQVTIDAEDMRDQLERYFNGLQRYFAAPGLHVNPLSPQVSDPTNHIDKEIEAICMMLNVPKRVFMGSERGELASSQDAKRWYGQCHFRQQRFITPSIVVPFIDHLIKYGLLPEPQEYFVHWPDIAVVTDQEEAEVSRIKTEMLNAYAQGNIPSIITPLDYLTKVAGFDKKEAKEMLENADKEIEKSVMSGIYASEEDEMAKAEIDAKKAEMMPQQQGPPFDKQNKSNGDTKKPAFGKKPVKNVFCPTGEGGGIDPTCSPTDWAKGVRAAKDLGGQVPQKSVDQADKILSKSGLKPTHRKVPAGKLNYIKETYESTRPVLGDTWQDKSANAEVIKIEATPTGKTAIDLFVVGKKGGRTTTVYTEKNWLADKMMPQRQEPPFGKTDGSNR